MEENTVKNKNITKSEIITFMFISFLIVLLLWDNTSPIPYDLYKILAPLKLYTTAIHEMCHGLVTIITGGNIVEVSLDVDGSGHVISQGGIGWLITSAGYIGSALIGGLLICSVNKELFAKILLIVIALTVTGVNVIYIDSFFSFAFVSSIIVSIAVIIVCLKTKLGPHIAIFLGTILAVDSFRDVKKILIQMPYETDAGILARSIGFEILTIPVAIIFSVICMYIWYMSIKYILQTR